MQRNRRGCSGRPVDVVTPSEVGAVDHPHAVLAEVGAGSGVAVQVLEQRGEVRRAEEHRMPGPAVVRRLEKGR